jgi:hypothetical protein
MRSFCSFASHEAVVVECLIIGNDQNDVWSISGGFSKTDGAGENECKDSAKSFHRLITA